MPRDCMTSAMQCAEGQEPRAGLPDSCSTEKKGPPSKKEGLVY